MLPVTPQVPQTDQETRRRKSWRVLVEILCRGAVRAKPGWWKGKCQKLVPGVIHRRPDACCERCRSCNVYVFCFPSVNFMVGLSQ